MELKTLISHILFFLAGLNVAAALYLGNQTIVVSYFTRTVTILITGILFLIALSLMASSGKEREELEELAEKHREKCLGNKDSSGKSDRDRISCSQDHELKYVLRKYEKRGTKKNIKAMRKLCRRFKKSIGTDDRQKFYEYLEDKGRLEKFE